MAATDPRREPDHVEHESDRSPRLSAAPTSPRQRSRWIPIAIAIALLIVIAVVAYFDIYAGDSGGGGGGGGPAGGEYLLIAFGGDRIRRIAHRLEDR